MTPKTEEAAPQLTYEAVELLVAKIKPRITNRKISPESVRELAANILQNGLQTPITVRPEGEGHLIVAGERRWLAHKELDRETIMCFIRKMDDDEAEEFALIENLMRENLHPIEEAQQFEIILRHPDYTIDRLVKRVSKDLPYVRKRLELLKLISPVRKLFLEGRIGVEQAKQLCRIPADQQKAYLQWIGPMDDGRGMPAAPKIDEWIQHNVMLDLSKAPFDTSSTELVKKAGACLVCPKRTGFDKALFDDVKKGDFCLDAVCFNGKVDRLINITLKAEPKTVQVSTAHSFDERPKEALGADKYTEIAFEGENCDKVSQAIVTHGLDRGRRLVICKDQTCKEHAGRHREQHAVSEDPKDREKRLKTERAEKAKKETRRNILKAISEKVDELKHPELQILASSMFRRLWGQMQHKVMRILDWKRELKKGESLDDVFMEEIAKAKGTRLNQILVILALASHMDGPAFDDKNDALMDFASRYKINVEKITEEIAAKYKPKAKK